MTEGINHVPPNERLVQLHKDLENVNGKIKNATAYEAIKGFISEDSANTLSEEELHQLSMSAGKIKSERVGIQDDIAIYFARMNDVTESVAVGSRGLLADGLDDSIVDLFTEKVLLADLSNDVERADKYRRMVREGVKEKLTQGNSFSDAFFDTVDTISSQRKNILAGVGDAKYLAHSLDTGAVRTPEEAKPIIGTNEREQGMGEATH